MISLQRLTVLALLSLASASTGAATVDFCKVKKVYDEHNASIPPEIVYEDCSGEAYLGSVGKDAVKAKCWAGASDLLEGKCDAHKATTTTPESTEAPADESLDGFSSEADK